MWVIMNSKDTSRKNSMLKDFWFWYKQQAPKYGYISSIWDCIHNARYFKRNGEYRIKTNGEVND